MTRDFLLKVVGVPEVLLPVALALCERETDKDVAGFVQETSSSGLLIFTSPKGAPEVKEFYVYHISTGGARLIDSAPVSLLSVALSRFPVQSRKTAPPSRGYNKGRNPSGGPT